MSELTKCTVLTDKDTAQVKSLWATCFEDTPQFTDWYFDNYYQPEYALGVKQGEELLASAQIIPYTLEVRAERLAAGYVVGVMTAPKGRNCGYAKSLLLASLEKMKAENVPLALLMPFEGQFYYRYGWSFCYFQEWYQIKPQDLACLAAPYGEVKEVEPQAHLVVLQELYQEMMRKYHGTAYRTEKAWLDLLADYTLEGGKCFLLIEDGKYSGYMLCLPQEKRLVVQELAYRNKKAYQGLLWFLQQQEQSLEIHTAPSDELAFALAKTKEGIIHYPFLMARIVDVVQCLQRISYPTDCPACVFEVQDDFASWNTGKYCLTVKQGKGEIFACEEDRAELTLDIQGLTMLVMGVRTAEQLLAEGRLETVDKELLAVWNSLWPLKNNYINAYY